MTHTIKISDDYCEWKFVLYNSGMHSIQDLLNAVLEKTGLESDYGTLVNGFSVTSETESLKELVKAQKELLELKDKRIEQLILLNDVNNLLIDTLNEIK